MKSIAGGRADAPSLDELVKQGEGDQDAVDLGDGIFMSRNIANSYLVTTSRRRPDDQHRHRLRGARHQGPLLAEVSSGPLRTITFTQGHPDHVGGWSHFDGAGVETIAQANHPDVREYWRNLHPFYVRRIMKLWGAFMDVEAQAADAAARACTHRPPSSTATAFELGGRRFELYVHPRRGDHRRPRGLDAANTARCSSAT